MDYLRSKNQGFSSTSSNLKNIYAYDTVYNCNSITLPCGIYYINYKFELNYNVSLVNYWLNFGLGSTILLIDLQQNKNYCSSSGNITIVVILIVLLQQMDQYYIKTFHLILLITQYQ